MSLTYFSLICRNTYIQAQRDPLTGGGGSPSYDDLGLVLTELEEGTFPQSSLLHLHPTPLKVDHSSQEPVGT